MRETPLLLYSAGSRLAYAIAERFYGGVHYVWCSPFYDGVVAARHINVPPTSSPAEIYRNLEEETRRGDRHSTLIKQNRNAIESGARAKRTAGIISETEFEEIQTILEEAETREFRPVLYLIPFDRVRGSTIDVPVRERASLLSVEYRVEALRSDCFDLLQLRR